MEISVTEAKARLTDLIRRAEQGEDIVLTRHGRPAVRLQPCSPRRLQEKTADEMTYEERLTWLRTFSRESAAVAAPGPSAAQASDFLYGEDGLPN